MLLLLLFSLLLLLALLLLGKVNAIFLELFERVSMADDIDNGMVKIDNDPKRQSKDDLRDSILLYMIDSFLVSKWVHLVCLFSVAIVLSSVSELHSLLILILKVQRL